MVMEPTSPPPGSVKPAPPPAPPPKTYFPILVQYVDGEKCDVETPADIESGRGFKVLKTNHKK